MDLFIPYQPHEVPLLPLCVAAVREFVRPGPSRVVLCGSREASEGGRGEPRLAEVTWLDEDEVIPGLTKGTMPEMPSPEGDRGPGYFRKFLAWALAKRSGEEVYGIVLPTCVFARPIEFVRGGALQLFEEGELNSLHVQTARRLMGYFEPAVAYARQFGAFHKEIVRQLEAAISIPRPWHRTEEAVLETIDVERADGFCEFNTYAWFARAVYPEACERRRVATWAASAEKTGEAALHAEAAHRESRDAVIYV